MEKTTTTSTMTTLKSIMANERLFLSVFAALLYAFSSFFITVVNKVVLTSYKFPSFQFLGLCQVVFGIVLLALGKFLKIISFPDFEWNLPRRIWPLPLVFFLNLITGLGGTQKLSLPMFTVLRRFSILFTMIAEFWIIGVKAPFKIQLCVYLMIIGAIIAGIFDLAFDVMGYTFVLLNDVFTAANGVYTKQKLEARDLGEFGLIYYNSIFICIPTFVIAFSCGDITKAMEFPKWSDAWFLLFFSLASFMGFILTFSIIFCTKHNSALTTTVIGVLKNLLITYLGMFIGGDYIFSWANFVGLNISAVGSVFYTFITFRSKTSSSVVPPCDAELDKTSSELCDGSSLNTSEVNYHEKTSSTLK